jgi:hypothetical protein
VLRRPSRSALKSAEGGLTAAGRAWFNARGAHLRPGVKVARTAEDFRRKGSFLRRHYAGPSNEAKPLVDAQGRPTRHSIQAQAWGERAPRTLADVRRLAALGSKLLAVYNHVKERR